MVDLNRDGCGRYEVHRKRKLWQGLSCYAAPIDRRKMAFGHCGVLRYRNGI